QPHAAALNLAQYDRVRTQRPANLLSDGRISMFGALNVEHTQTARLDHVPDRQQPAEEKHRRDPESERQPFESAHEDGAREDEEERKRRQQKPEKRPRV